MATQHKKGDASIDVRIVASGHLWLEMHEGYVRPGLGFDDDERIVMVTPSEVVGSCMGSLPSSTIMEEQIRRHERFSKTPQGKVVMLYNSSQLDLLKDPHNEDLLRDFRETVLLGSQAEETVLELHGLYIENKSYLLPESTHPVRIDNVVVMGNSAIVETVENPNRLSSSKRKYVRNNKAHTYTVKLVGDHWLVVSDDFEP